MEVVAFLQAFGAPISLVISVFVGVMQIVQNTLVDRLKYKQEALEDTQNTQNTAHKEAQAAINRSLSEQNLFYHNRVDRLEDDVKKKADK